jgi:hypothetical protein
VEAGKWFIPMDDYKRRRYLHNVVTGSRFSTFAEIEIRIRTKKYIAAIRKCHRQIQVPHRSSPNENIAADR